MSEINLPSWARFVEGSPRLAATIEVDTDAANNALLAELGAPLDQLDQYWLEVAYQCAKMDVQAALEHTEYDPRIAGCSHQINFTRAPQWALINFPVGRGTLLATKGREARAHYLRIRGRIPFSE